MDGALMSSLPRRPDYLRTTITNSNRLRNLELGIHPVSSDLHYWDDFGPDELEITDSRFELAEEPRSAKWFRRAARVHMLGAVIGPVSFTETIFARLPPRARPIKRQAFTVTCRTDTDMGIARMFVEVNGDVGLVAFASTFGGADVRIGLESAHWGAT